MLLPAINRVALASSTLLLCAFANAIDVVQGPIRYHGHTYYRLSASKWTEAEQYAVDQLKGHLVTINNAAENSFVLKTFAKAPNSGRVWIGLTDVGHRGNYTFISGESSNYSNWQSGEPNNAGLDEDYVLMYSDAGKWADTSNTGNFGFSGDPVYGVVEVDRDEVGNGNTNITVIKGPIVNPANNHSYYLLSSSRWSEADRYADDVLHGFLVSITDQAENDWVQNNFAKDAGRIWLGLTDTRKEGEFRYTSREVFVFSNWEPGEPNNSGKEDYALMYGNNGRWADVKDLAEPPGIGKVYGLVEVAPENASALRL
ncbi:MAG: C-type lectin domain-containing protein [bacterium]